MGYARPVKARDTALIRRLEVEWTTLATSRLMRERLRGWSTVEPVVDFDDGVHLVAAGQTRDSAMADDVLDALLRLGRDDAVAIRVALQVVLPGVKSLVDSVRGWDVEERTSRAVAETLRALAWCGRSPAASGSGFRVFTNTRRQLIRSAVRHRDNPIRFRDGLDGSLDPGPADGLRVDDLVEWLATDGGVSTESAALIVATRVEGVPLDWVASSMGVDAQTLRTRRRRAEVRARSRLEVSG